ncbi:hypothetical protein [Paracoccus albus]|uniref:hypothetical protein n=1 Tax=Paracoccus albus TaxID=3017784 RepID=UPI0022EFED2C|nr:hypothetical protein [Paracoccus albus]WBU61712.1 hypothetical protein PAF20_07405 [Paracoccus albus]
MTHPADTRIIFEDDQIRVVAQPAGRSHLVITFGNLEMLAEGKRFFADAPLAKLGISAIGIMAKSPNWFPVNSMERAVAAIRAIARDYRTVVTFGSSMGGYGALKHSARLGATQVIACEPQWSIDAAECAIAPGWKDYFRPDMSGMGIRADEVSGKVYILHDPWQSRDDWHARKIVSICPRSRIAPVYGAGHHVMKVLAGSAVLGQIINACRNDDIAALRRSISTARRRSAIRKREVLRRAADQHPALVLPQFLRLPPRAIAREFPEWLEPVAAQLKDKQGVKAVLSFYRSAFPHIRTLAGRNAFTHATAALTCSRPVLGFGPDQVMVYDAMTDIIRPGRRDPKIGEVPLHPEIRSGRLRLFCIAEELRLPIQTEPEGGLAVGPENARAARFMIESQSVLEFRLRAGDRYLTVNDRGHIRLQKGLAGAAVFSLTL